MERRKTEWPITTYALPDHLGKLVKLDSNNSPQNLNNKDLAN